MRIKNIQPLLLKTSAATDVLQNGNNVSITGLGSIPKNSISRIVQMKYKPEVVQVLTFTTTSETIVAGTLYQLSQLNVNVERDGYTQNIYTYGYAPTAAEVAVSQASVRTVICAAIAAQINALTDRNYCTAVATTDTIVITDNAGYYPYLKDGVGRKGATALSKTNGFTTATTLVTTTPAVYQFGDGTYLSSANNQLVFGAYYQNYVSGSTEAPMTAWNGTTPPAPAVAGQFYDAWVINGYVLGASATGMNDNQRIIMEQEWVVYVDNGTGSSTTNLAGFIAFQREMLKLQFGLYKSNPGTLYGFFDNGITYATLTGLSVIPTTALAEYTINLGDGQTASATPSVVATSAAVAAARIDATNGGLNLAIDAASGKGSEFSAHLDTHSDKQFIVGKQEFSCYYRVYVDDVSGVDPAVIGFRKKAAYAAALATNTDYATIGLVGGAGDIKTATQLASGGQTTTDTTLNWADGETHELEVRVAIDGTVKFYVDGQQVNKSTTFTFAVNTVLIPFTSELQTADVAANWNVIQFASLPTAYWRI